MLREWIVMPLFLLRIWEFSPVISVWHDYKFICNLVTSTNNRLLLQLRRWHAPEQELVAVMMAMVTTYHHHRCRLLYQLSQNRAIYKNTSTMAARKRSHCHTWANKNPIVRRVPRRVLIQPIKQPRSYMIQHTCHMLDKVHKYSSFIRVWTKVITNHVQVR